MYSNYLRPMSLAIALVVTFIEIIGWVLNENLIKMGYRCCFKLVTLDMNMVLEKVDVFAHEVNDYKIT